MSLQVIGGALQFQRRPRKSARKQDYDAIDRVTNVASTRSAWTTRAHYAASRPLMRSNDFQPSLAATTVHRFLGCILDEVSLTCIEFGQIVRDQQSHSGTVDVNATSNIPYAYDYGTADKIGDVCSCIASLVDDDNPYLAD